MITTQAALKQEIARNQIDRDGSIDTSCSLAQLGRPLTSSDVIKRLQTANPYLHFIVSSADNTKYGVYHIEGGKLRFICGMEHGFMPEFSIRHVEPVLIPDPDNPGGVVKAHKFIKETRGYRTVLSRLLKESLITEPQIETLFSLSAGRSSKLWQQSTN